MSTVSLVDAHVHLWEVDRFEYGWLDAFPRLDRSYTLEEYTRATGDISVEGMLFVECTESFDDRVAREEVQWVESLAERDERLQGIVAHASLEKGAASREHLDWLAERPLVSGVRRILQDESPDALLRSDFVEGIRLLSRYDFSFDLTVKAPQLENVVELVDRCPGVRFVLDHIGKPAIREERLDPWRTHLAQLAEREHVSCKLSGVLTEADPETWTAEDVEPYLEHALRCFGPDRLLFGGDWPVLRLAADYPTWADLLHTHLQSYSDEEQRKILQENARRVYRLT